MPQNEVRKIEIRVKTSGDGNLRKVSRELGLLNQNVRKTQRSLNLFSTFVQGAFALSVVRQVTRFSDEIQLLRDRIRVFSKDSQEAEATFAGLVQAAQLTNTSVASLSTSFNRLALATKDLGLSNEAILATTVALQNTFRISGATIAETTGSVIQLSQGLSAGALRGQELRSVLEANGEFSRLLADEFGVVRGQLIKLAETGAITSQRVFKVLAENFDELNQRAGQISPTIGQSATIALDQFKIKLEEVARSLGIPGGFNDLVFLAAQNVDLLTASLIGLASAFAAVKVASFIAGAGGIVKALKAVGAALVSINTLVVGAVAVFGFLVAASDRVKQKVGLNIELAFQKIFQSIAKGTLALSEFAKKIPLLGDTFGELGQLSSKFALEETTQNINRITKELADLEEQAKKESLDKLFERAKKELLDFSKTADGTDRIIAKTRFKELNALFRQGSLSVNEYRERLDKLELEKLNQDFTEGRIALDEYNQGLAKLDENATSAQRALTGLEQGLLSVQKSAGTFSTAVADGIRATFSALEDSLVSFIRKGEFEFEKFTNAILDDLTRIIVRASIIGPLSNALLSGIGGGTTVPAPQSPGTAGNSGFGNQPTFRAAAGGIFTRPSVSIFGEAGPEAVVPLKRGPDGNLGIAAPGGVGGGSPVQVNVINQSGASASVSESTGPRGEKVIDVLVRDQMKKAFADGTMDRTMTETYGVRRKGF